VALAGVKGWSSPAYNMSGPPSGFDGQAEPVTEEALLHGIQLSRLADPRSSTWSCHECEPLRLASPPWLAGARELRSIHVERLCAHVRVPRLWSVREPERTSASVGTGRPRAHGADVPGRARASTARLRSAPARSRAEHPALRGTRPRTQGAHRERWPLPHPAACRDLHGASAPARRLAVSAPAFASARPSASRPLCAPHHPLRHRYPLSQRARARCQLFMTASGNLDLVRGSIAGVSVVAHRAARRISA